MGRANAQSQDDDCFQLTFHGFIHARANQGRNKKPPDALQLTASYSFKTLSHFCAHPDVSICEAPWRLTRLLDVRRHLSQCSSYNTGNTCSLSMGLYKLGQRIGRNQTKK
jgi:hypothetical protein